MIPQKTIDIDGNPVVQYVYTLGAAGDLEIGDILYTADGDEVKVTEIEIEKLDEPILVYNLEIEDFHTYFVGDVPVLVHNNCNGVQDNSGSRPNSLPKQAGKGQSKGGRHEPANLNEKLAMEEVITNPKHGICLDGKNTDPRWPAKDGWEKWAQNVNGYEIHYQYNPLTGEIDDVKIK